MNATKGLTVSGTKGSGRYCGTEYAQSDISETIKFSDRFFMRVPRFPPGWIVMVMGKY